MSGTEATPVSAERFGPDFWHVALADPDWFVGVLAPQLIGAMEVISTGRIGDPDVTALEVLDRVAKAVEQKRAKLPRSKR